MTKKKKVTKKVTKKSTKKPVKVVIEEKVVDQGEFKLKEENAIPEPKLLPKDKEVKPEGNPNDPTQEKVADGFKRPSITNVQEVYTKKQMEAVIKAYWERFPDMEEKNPAKYRAKKSELAQKLANIKE